MDFKSQMEKAAGMMRFETEGSPGQRGRTHAEACRTRVLGWLERVLRSPGNAGQRERSAAMRRMDQTAAVMPDAAEEMRGIASGLGVEWEDYVLACFPERPRTKAPRCSTFGARTPEGRPLVGKTDDLAPELLGMNALQNARPDKGHAHVKIHFQGTVGVSSGVNRPGLVVALTGIPGPETEKPGVPGLWLVDLLLRACGTVAEAVETVRRTPIAFYGCSLLLADRQDDMTLIEKNVIATKVLQPSEGGVFIHTNHILDPEMERVSPRQNERLHANSVARLDLLQESARSAIPATVQSFERLLARRNEKAAIWQNGNAVLHTDHALIAAPHQGSVLLFTSPPGTAVPEEVPVPSGEAKR